MLPIYIHIDIFGIKQDSLRIQKIFLQLFHDICHGFENPLQIRLSEFFCLIIQQKTLSGRYLIIKQRYSIYITHRKGKQACQLVV